MTTLAVPVCLEGMMVRGLVPIDDGGGPALRRARTGTYHRVYWAGAAFALAVDVRLRKNSNGEMTLLRAISASGALTLASSTGQHFSARCKTQAVPISSRS